MSGLGLVGGGHACTVVVLELLVRVVLERACSRYRRPVRLSATKLSPRCLVILPVGYF